MYIFPEAQAPGPAGSPPAAVQYPEPAPEPEAAFYQAQELFFAWTDVIYRLLQEVLTAIQPQLAEKQVAYDPEDPGNVDVYAKGVDVTEWRMDFHFRPTRDCPRPVDAAWQKEVEGLVLNALAPLRRLLPALGVNEYLFDGLNREVDGLSLPIEPYEDAAVVDQLRYLMRPAAQAAADETEE